MDILEMFEALGGYFLLPVYAVGYTVESVINLFADLGNEFIDALNYTTVFLENLINTLYGFVSWLPTVVLIPVMFLLILLPVVIGIRFVTKIIQTIKLGGWFD